MTARVGSERYLKSRLNGKPLAALVVQPVKIIQLLRASLVLNAQKG
jgi:hypothetical protein